MKNHIKEFFKNTIIYVDDPEIKDLSTKQLLSLLDQEVSMKSGNRIVKEILSRVVKSMGIE